jgi:hypothetical protein
MPRRSRTHGGQSAESQNLTVENLPIGQVAKRSGVLEIDSKIADLPAIRERIAIALHAGCESLTTCMCPVGPRSVGVGTGSLAGWHN